MVYLVAIPWPSSLTTTDIYRVDYQINGKMDRGARPKRWSPASRAGSPPSVPRLFNPTRCSNHCLLPPIVSQSNSDAIISCPIRRSQASKHLSHPPPNHPLPPHRLHPQPAPEQHTAKPRPLLHTSSLIRRHRAFVIALRPVRSALGMAVQCSPGREV